MGSSQLLFQFLSPARIVSPPTQTNHLILTRTNNSGCCCFCTTNSRSGDRGGGSRWYPNTGKTERFDFNREDEFLSSDYEAFDFRSGTENNPKRKWWSGDSFLNDDEDEVEDEDDDDFGVLEGTIGGISWITKVFRAFGWLVPAIALSLLVGTGPNAIVMALALPLAQSALSLVVDTLWGRPRNSKYKPRTKRRPFARAANTAGMRKERVKNTGNEASFRKRETSTGSFGGWDELDEEVPLMTKTQKENEPSRQKKGKLSRTVRKRDKPLVIRLLIAVFPFLGSWTRLL